MCMCVCVCVWVGGCGCGCVFKCFICYNSGKPVTKIGREEAHPAIVRKNNLGGFFTG